MSELSTKIKSDTIFNSVYEAFSSKFPEYTYESSDDVVAFKEGGILLGRIFFLKDTSGSVRFIKLIIGQKKNEQLLGDFFKNQIEVLLTTEDGDLYAQADIQLTTFAVKVLDLNDKDLTTNIISITNKVPEND